MSTTTNINSDIAQKLELLQSTKADIQSAIADTGQVISDATPFSEYADLIRAIPVGIDENKLFITTKMPTNIGNTSTSITFNGVEDFNFFTILAYSIKQAEKNCPSGSSYVVGIVGSKKDKYYQWVRTTPTGSTASSGSFNINISESNGSVTFSIPSVTPSYNTYFVDGYLLYYIALND